MTEIVYAGTLQAETANENTTLFDLFVFDALLYLTALQVTQSPNIGL